MLSDALVGSKVIVEEHRTGTLPGDILVFDFGINAN